MKKCIAYIKLSKIPLLRQGNRDNSVNYNRFNHWTKGLIVIPYIFLSVSFGHKSGLIPFNYSISMPFNLVYPAISKNIDIGRFWNKGLGFSLVKSSNILIHYMTLMLVFDSLSVGRGFGA